MSVRKGLKRKQCSELAQTEAKKPIFIAQFSTVFSHRTITTTRSHKDATQFHRQDNRQRERLNLDNLMLSRERRPEELLMNAMILNGLRSRWPNRASKIERSPIQREPALPGSLTEVIVLMVFRIVRHVLHGGCAIVNRVSAHNSVLSG